MNPPPLRSRALATLTRTTSIQIERTGRAGLHILYVIGDFTLFTLSMFRCLVTSLPRRDALVSTSYRVGVLSVPVIMITGMFIGMVLAVQTYAQLEAVGLETRMGALINLSLVKELGPVLAATMLAGRVGSAMAAELGTMRVTEQIDALWCLGINPIQYLVVPRFLACFLLIPCLVAIGDCMGMLGGSAIGVYIFGIDSHYYWQHSTRFIGTWDIFCGVFKSFFFGGAIAVVSCHRGFDSTGGAEGVGKAATEAFVVSFIAILGLDFFLGILLEAAETLLFAPMAQPF